MARRAALWAGAILLGIFLGAGSALWALGHADRFAQQHYGAWAFNPLAGSEAADPYMRAVIARAGLLAARADETISFELDADSAARPLDEACVYALNGAPLPARWWSATIYAPDAYLPRNSDHAFSFDATRAEGDGRWSARISAVRGDAIHWISSRDARRGFTLTLRLYQPRQQARQHPDTIALPTLDTISCPGDAA